MFLLLLALFVLAPIVEIYVLLTAGAAFDVPAVIAACLGTAFLGGWIIRLQGLAALNAARTDMNAGTLPVASAVDGAVLIAAAPLLMTPGFITDALGFSLLIPPVRRALARYVLNRIKKRIERGDATITITRY